MTERRGPWYLLTGLILGALLGLLYAWTVSPVRYVNATPASLRADFKDAYRGMIALAYAASGDLGRARVRLDLLKEPSPAGALILQAQQEVGKSPESEVRALAQLAAAVNASPATTSPLLPSPMVISTVVPRLEASAASSAVAVVTAALVTATTVFPTATATQTLTATPLQTLTLMPGSLTPLPGSATPTYVRPTRTPTQALMAPFVLKDRKEVCDPGAPPGVLKVQVSDAASQPLAGIKVLVNWADGEDQFFTGLKPENGAGYADFTMTPHVVYTLRVEEAGQAVNNLSTPDCPSPDGQNYWGGLLLTFTQR